MVYGKKKLTFIFFDFFALKHALKTILKLSVLSAQLSDLKVHLFKKTPTVYQVHVLKSNSIFSWKWAKMIQKFIYGNL